MDGGRVKCPKESPAPLCAMAEGQSVTHKLTKRPLDMMKIEELPDWIRSITQVH